MSGLRIGPQLMDGLSAGRSPPRRKRKRKRKGIQYMVTSVFQDQQYMFGIKSLLVDKKVLLMKTWPMCCFDD